MCHIRAQGLGRPREGLSSQCHVARSKASGPSLVAWRSQPGTEVVASRAGGCGVLGSGKNKQRVAEGDTSLGWPCQSPRDHTARIGGAGTRTDKTHGVPVYRSHVCALSFVCASACSHACVPVCVHVGGGRGLCICTSQSTHMAMSTRIHVSAPVTQTFACLPACVHPHRGGQKGDTLALH